MFKKYWTYFKFNTVQFYLKTIFKIENLLVRYLVDKCNFM